MTTETRPLFGRRQIYTDVETITAENVCDVLNKAYETQYNEIMAVRHASQNFAKRFSNFDRVCLLCSEPTPEQCHRRLLAEILCKDWPDISIVHL